MLTYENDIDLALSPGGRLFLENAESTVSESALSPLDKQLHELFLTQPMRGLLQLGLSTTQIPLPPGLSFWRRFSHDFINTVCRCSRTDTGNSEAWRTLSPPLEELKVLV